ncbi:MAG TPA: LamG domain-containing protein [Bacteroidota bacterium]|nr:LamG domain-containing protein [Bacteroidota bacterium]
MSFRPLHPGISLIAVALLSCTSPKHREIQGRPQAASPSFVIDLRGGSRIVGTPLRNNFSLSSSHGPIGFTLDQVSSMTFSDSAGNVRIEFRNGDILAGSLSPDSLPVEFAAGKLTLPVSSILRIASAGSESSLAMGLVAHYPLHGNTKDVSGEGRDGKNFGAVPAPDRFGVPGRALEFDGSGAHVNLPDGLIDPEGKEYTFSLWVLTRSSSVPREALYIGAATAEVSIWNDHGRFIFGPGVVDALMHEASAPATENVFTHLTAVYVRGTSARLYVNGEYRSTAKLPDLPLRSGLPEYSSGIGTYAPEHPEHGRRFGRLNWSGSISDVRIYNRALSDEEIRLLAQAND